MAKRKGWKTPGIDEIQNYWWKKLEPAQKASRRAFTNTATCSLTGITVLLPKIWRMRRITSLYRA